MKVCGGEPAAQEKKQRPVGAAFFSLRKFHRRLNLKIIRHRRLKSPLSARNWRRQIPEVKKLGEEMQARIGRRSNALFTPGIAAG
jgi:hypothetical protein